MTATGDSLNYYFAINGYMAIETDADGTATYMYYQYMNKFGAWYILRSEAISSTAYEYKFTKGSSGASAAWALRATPVVSYDFPDVIFKDL